MSKTPPPPNPTPAMRQFHQFKEQYPDAVLFFRMGDFYETFYEDAEICSRVLGISLTCRNKTSDHPIPLAGVPYHALEKYLHNMIKAGYKVAVCEQMEDPSQAKGVVKREVVRLVTAGTLTEEALLDEREENFLAAISFDPKNMDLNGKQPVGIAWVELSTGQFFSQLVESRFLLDELVRLAPRECLIADDPAMTPKGFFDQLKDLTQSAVTRRSGWTFDHQHALSLLQKHFAVTSLEGFGYASVDSSACAAGVIIDYLNETQKTTLGHIATLRRANRDKFLKLDQTTLRSLEVEKTLKENSVKGSMRQSLDKTITAMGSRKFRNWICFPLIDLEEIELRQDAIGELLREDTLRDNLRQSLSRICDIERVTSRISTGRAGPRDLLSLAQALHELPALESLLQNTATDLLTQSRQQCGTQEKTANLIESAIDPETKLTIRDGGVIRTGYNEEVDRLRSLCQEGQTWLAGYQKRLIDQTGFANLKVGFNRVFGYYVEITHAFRGELPGDFIRKQTLKNAERYITDELKKYEAEALTAEQRCKALEEKLFLELRTQVAAQTLHLQQVADAVARLDVLSALAHLARKQNYCRPQMHPEKDMEILDGRHPVLDQTLGNDFIPNDVQLGNGARDLVLITGPNMSGKSTYIRQTALLVLLAHTGSYIPAHSAQIGIVDRIFTRVGASDELTKGQSTFMVEMIETANIVNNATERSLVILDEIGRGTSTYDGLSLAWAIVEHMATHIKCRTLFATHYHEITELADLLDNVDNANVSVREWKDEVIFLHKILPGRTDKSYGIHVARLAGLPKTVLNRSNEILQELESNFAREAHDPHMGGRLKEQSSDKQLLLFDPPPPEDQIREKLANTNVNDLTPLQALNLLEELKKEAHP